MVQWTREYKGQSPGDLENKKNGFAGRFLGYDSKIRSPSDKLPSNLPVILIVGDSIIGDVCVMHIQHNFRGVANVNFLQQPHHCKNISSWLDAWKVDEWTQYHCIFWFDGMHGFPERVTEIEHQELTPILVNRIRKSVKNILWCNCTPIPDDMPQGQKNSAAGPNSKEQRVTNESVINRNASIKNEMDLLGVELLDIYSVIKPIQGSVQLRKDLHFNGNGQKLIAGNICKRLTELFFNMQNMGTVYGGWAVPKNIDLNANSVVYSGGVGEDMSFDILLSSKYNCHVVLIDPTQKAIAHFDQVKQYYQTRQPFTSKIQKDYYQTIERATPNFDKMVYNPLGLWNVQDTLKFYKNKKPNHVSQSFIENMFGNEFEMVEVNSIANIMKSYGHTQIDLLKIDIEGAEIQVLNGMLDDKIFPRYLCVEFDLKLKNKDKGETSAVIDRLIKNGYYIVVNDKWNITFEYRKL